MPWDTATGFIAKDLPGKPDLVFRVSARLYLFTAVSGINTLTPSAKSLGALVQSALLAPKAGTERRTRYRASIQALQVGLGRARTLGMQN